MWLLQGLQLGGLYVLLPLLSTVFCQSVRPEQSGCSDRDFNVTRAIGEQWLLPNCGGVATCRASVSGTHFVIRDSCPEMPRCRILDEGDPSAVFPRCCPRLACDFCHSEKLGRYFGPDSSWTEDHCVRQRCRTGPSGTVERHTDTCRPLGPPPSLDCQVVEQDMARGEYPLCCAHYRCPGLCRSGDRWVPREGQRPDSCYSIRSRANGQVSPYV